MDLVRKGLRFSLTEKIDGGYVFQLNTEFWKFAYQSKWQQYRNRNDLTPTGSSFPKYPESSEIFIPPPHPTDIFSTFEK